MQAFAIRRWLDRVRLADGHGDPFDDKFVLAFMLLHEMGHVSHGVSGAYVGEEISAVNMEGSNANHR
ncbi:hypothetical protein [Rhizobium leguminosarum]|uniref:hypothetical protein n=1 Tax=Rhizobium leguminosarum TaxID=384 RepID=UPI001C976E7C|nr:hypothetical protein [Rhizobium leguminosarum]MBY5523572.1 hypothetical protein [Rhizobium leguminosarum]